MAYIYLVFLVTKGRITVSDFIFYFGIITGFSNWVVGLVFSYSQIERSCDECAAYRKYIENEDASDKGRQFTDSKINTIELKNVCYKYPSAENNNTEKYKS